MTLPEEGKGKATTSFEYDRLKKEQPLHCLDARLICQAGVHVESGSDDYHSQCLTTSL